MLAWVKLAWAFVNIMNVVHHCAILHNDLSKDNIILHFPVDKPNVMFISMCDWGEVGRLQEVTPSLYGFAKEQDANTKKMHWWVSSKLFFVYNESRTTNSLRQLAKQHTTNLKSEAYSMCKLTNVMWGDDWDVKYFVDNSTNMSFGKLIHDMYDLNPKA